MGLRIWDELLATLQRSNLFVNPPFFGPTAIQPLETKKQHWQQENQDCQQSCRCIPQKPSWLLRVSAANGFRNLVWGVSLPGSEFENLKLRLFYAAVHLWQPGKECCILNERQAETQPSEWNQLCREISTKHHLWDEEIWRSSVIFPCLHFRDSLGLLLPDNSHQPTAIRGAPSNRDFPYSPNRRRRWSRSWKTRSTSRWPRAMAASSPPKDSKSDKGPVFIS